MAKNPDRFDIRVAFELSKSLIWKHRTIASGMAELVKLKSSEFPAYDWTRIARLDFASDAAAMREHVIDVIHEEAPTSEVSGFWFGLFDPIYDGEENATRGIYLAGSERFDPGRSDEEWPVGPEYFPEHRYFRSKILETFYSESQNCPAGNPERLASEFDYTFCLAFTGFWLHELMTTTDPAILLGGRDFRGVGFGFDSGDLLTLGVLRPTGFELIES